MPHIEAIARAIILQRGYVLLCQNKKHGYSYLPGGHIEFGESAADAVARELMEEAGLRVRVGACASVDESVFVQKGKRRHEVNVLFRASLTRSSRGGRGVPAGVASLEDHIAFAWVPVRGLGRVDLRPAHHAKVVRACARRPAAKSCVFSSFVGR